LQEAIGKRDLDRDKERERQRETETERERKLTIKIPSNARLLNLSVIKGTRAAWAGFKAPEEERAQNVLICIEKGIL